jgi:DNA-binding NarL/FixJ family response regulator
MLTDASDVDMAGFLPVAWHAALAASALERDADAVRLAVRAVTRARRTGRQHILPPLLAVMAAAQLRLGHLADAAGTVEHLDDALFVAPRAGLAGLAAALHAEVERGRGNVKTAIRYAEQAVAAPRPEVVDWADAPVAGLGAALLAAGDADGCLRVMGGSAGSTVAWHALGCEAAVAAGRLDDARGWADAAARAATRSGLPGTAGHAALARARVALAGGDPETAATLAARAATGFADLGWQPMRDRALAVAAAATPRPEPPARGGGALTRREHEIAELVARGHSNREIAELLFLSTRTVDSHVARILRKIGVHSRAAVASRLAATNGRA